MAISKKVKVMWFDTTNYVQILSVVTDRANEWTWYNVQVIVNFFTNNTTEYKYDSQQFIFKNLTEKELSLPALYWKLMELKEFEWYKAC